MWDCCVFWEADLTLANTIPLKGICRFVGSFSPTCKADAWRSLAISFSPSLQRQASGRDTGRWTASFGPTMSKIYNVNRNKANHTLHVQMGHSLLLSSNTIWEPIVNTSQRIMKGHITFIYIIIYIYLSTSAIVEPHIAIDLRSVRD
jgi:hypothetical protein